MKMRGLNLGFVLLFLWMAAVACGPECPTGQTKCGEVCINTKTDRNHCGACGTVCDAGKICADGACAISCQQDLTECEGTCVNTKTDSGHCGACGTACKAGERCKEGKCEINCPDGQTVCEASCVNTKTNVLHCGACGTKCDPGQVCKDGKCETICAKGLTSCGGSCVDTNVERDHCGACDAKCESGQVCNAGKCALSCQKDLTDCSGSCVNPKTDIRHCGACGKVCAGGEVCKDGSCVISCQDGFTDCSGACVNTKASRLHCGACGTACGDGEECVDGKCTLSCQTDLTACNGSCVNLQSDSKHCGACGMACTGNDVCQSGKCAFYCQSGFTECSQNCVDLQRNLQHCGACGMACQANEVCAQGKCTQPCSGGTRPCNNVCIDYTNDAANCGRCGRACQAGEACLDSKCVPCTDCPNWATAVGAFNSDYVYGIAVDSAGNSYVTGYFSDLTQIGKTRLTSYGGSDMFVAKFSPSGKVLWAVNGGGPSTDYGYSVTADSSGNVYVTGAFQGVATFGSLSVTSAGGYDIYVAKLDKDGNFLWVKSYGGTSSDYGYGIALDSTGNPHITGQIYNTVQFGSTTLTAVGGSDIFAAKLDSTGKELWAVSAGSSSSEQGERIAVDASGNVYIVGRFYSSITWGSTTLTSAGSSDVFVAKFDSTGKPLWATSGGGTGIDYGYDLDVDSTGNVYITGAFSSSGADFGTTKLTSAGGYDIYVAKLDNTGKWAWAVGVGSGSSDYGYGVGVDSKGNVFATGYFYDTVIFGKTSLTAPSSSTQIFLMQIDNTGKIVGATQMGGTSSDYAYDLKIDSKDNIYVGGYFSNIVDFSKISLISFGSSDGYIAKYTQPSEVLCPSTGYKICNKICIDTSSDPVNCGGCNSLCTAGSICSAGKCLTPPTGLILQEVNVGATDYIVIKNTGTTDVDLAGIELYMNDSTTSFSPGDFTFTLPSFILKAGATVNVVESGAQTGEILASSMPYTYASNFLVLMCFGPCKETQSSNILDAVLIGTSSVITPTGVTFNGGGVANMSSSEESTSSYVRTSTMGKNPTYEQTDWAIKPQTR